MSSEPRTDQDAAHEPASQPAEPVRYPTNHVVAVVNTADQVESAAQALTDGGFLESEIEVIHGEAAADALSASTGRTGLAHLAIRIAERLNVADEEMELKDHYEQALRDGRFTVSVLAPTEERKQKAGQILRDNGAHSVNFLGRFSIEVMRR